MRQVFSSQELSANENGTWHSNVEGENLTDPVTTRVFSNKITTIKTDEFSPQTTTYISTAQRRLSRVSWTLLCYPIIYFVLVLPLAVARIMEFANKDWSLTSVYVGGALFDVQGIVNVILYTATRQGIISWDRIFRKHKYDNRPTSSFESRFPHTLERSI
jgi:hypothetical protein